MWEVRKVGQEGRKAYIWTWSPVTLVNLCLRFSKNPTDIGTGNLFQVLLQNAFPYTVFAFTDLWMINQIFFVPLCLKFNFFKEFRLHMQKNPTHLHLYPLHTGITNRWTPLRIAKQMCPWNSKWTNLCLVGWTSRMFLIRWTSEGFSSLCPSIFNLKTLRSLQIQL